MSNYKWITYSVDESPLNVALCDENFRLPIAPCVPAYSVDSLICEELNKKGIRLELINSHTSSILSQGYSLHPTSVSYVSITAPLYKASESGNYEKIADSYTGTTADISQYEWIWKEFEHCRQTVKKTQADRFQMLFNESSLDDGLTACIEITSRTGNLNGLFCEKYIPNNFFKICHFIPSSLTGPNGDEVAIFMKKMNAHGSIVTIKVPEYLKGLIIGANGQNIRRIAKIINAKRINVI